MKIFLIRHGESISDIEDRYGGDFDDLLTEKGRSQACELADRLEDKGIQVIFSSSRKRVKETAKILKFHLGCDLKIINDLRERNSYGVLTGMKKSEAKEKYPELVKTVKDRKNTIKEAKLYEDFTKRVSSAFCEVLKEDYGAIAIITHGWPICALFSEFFKFGELDEKIEDCAVIEIKKEGQNYKLIKTDGAILKKL